MTCLVFAGTHYYPEGGWRDLRGRFETVEEAKKETDKRWGAVHGAAADQFEYDWWQIVHVDGDQMWLIEEGHNTTR